MKSRRGISIVEVTVVVAILAIFAMIIAPLVYYSSEVYTMDSGRSVLLEKAQYALTFMEREIENAQRINILQSGTGDATLEFLRNRPNLKYRRIFEEFSFDSSSSSQSDWLRFRKGVSIGTSGGYAKVIDGVKEVKFTGYAADGVHTTTDVNRMFSVYIEITVADKFNRTEPVTVYGRATLRTHRNLVHMYVYRDFNRRSSWAYGNAPDEVADFFSERGFTVVKADELQDVMVKSIIENEASKTVVVMAQDVVPDTIALYALRADTDSNGNLTYKIVKNDPVNDIPYFCIIRQFMNAGGRVVWYADIPFYYYDQNGHRHTWQDGGSKKILGIDPWTNNSDSLNKVKITNFSDSNNGGYQWGLSYRWKSRRPTYLKYLDGNEKDSFNNLDNTYNSGFSSLLAEDSKGYAAAYFRNYDVSHPTSGFVRIFDNMFSDLSIHELQDMYRVSTFESTFNIPFKRAVYYDSLFPTEWIKDKSSKNIVKYFHERGFFALDAQQLQAFMQNAVFYNSNSDSSDAQKPYSYTVVVMAKDVAPDTVANVKKDSAIIRRYMNADATGNHTYGKGGNGRVVWIGYAPFYYQGHFDGNSTDWGSDGSNKVLGFDSAGGDANDNQNVTITSGGWWDYGNGEDWGLKTEWKSNQPEEKSAYFLIPPAPNYVDEVLAYYDTSGWFLETREVSAWFKKYGTEDKGGLVRIWDYDIGDTLTSNLVIEELLKVAEYEWP